MKAAPPIVAYTKYSRMNAPIAVYSTRSVCVVTLSGLTFATLSSVSRRPFGIFGSLADHTGIRARIGGSVVRWVGEQHGFRDSETDPQRRPYHSAARIRRLPGSAARDSG